MKILKPILITFSLFLSCFIMVGQNLVPNPSFENVIQCPFAFGMEDYVSDWKSARETPDYFNSCATWWGASVSTNIYGYQQAYTGNAYIGMLTYRSDSSIYTESASVQLNSPLTLGLTYYVSFRVSLALENSTGSMAANNKIGVQFSTTNYSPSNPMPINNFAHIWTDSIITDTVNWTMIKGSFVADSTYTYLNLGNFFDKQYIDSITYGGVFGAYYYFDEVCVSTDSTLCYQTVGLNDIPSNKFLFNIYPNPVADYFNVNQSFNEPYDLIVYNTLGQKLYEEKNIIIENKIINTTQFTKGLLLINIKSNNQTVNYKLLKQ